MSLFWKKTTAVDCDFQFQFRKNAVCSHMQRKFLPFLGVQFVCFSGRSVNEIAGSLLSLLLELMPCFFFSVQGCALLIFDTMHYDVDSGNSYTVALKDAADFYSLDGNRAV
uniref:TAXi_C domain-containing protein n=1 Tax=Ascaris lumbricoides TaxID=6252 RepID=A0A0M3I2G9_ASCLU